MHISHCMKILMEVMDDLKQIIKTEANALI